MTNLAVDLATDLAIGLDPVLLARRDGIDPDPWQATLLRSRASRTLLCCSRQSGKSLATALVAVHEALFHGPALVLIVAPALRQAENLFRSVKRALTAAGAEYNRNTVREAELGNGSRIVCLPDKEATIRSYAAVSLLIIDEAAWVRDGTYEAVLPMLAISQGRTILLSTPMGRRGFFFSEWENGGPRWERVKVTAYDCPRIDPAWLEEQKQNYPPLRFRSEFLCHFCELEDAVFSYDDVMAAVSEDVPLLFEEEN
jgi:hypothetical protein